MRESDLIPRRPAGIAGAVCAAALCLIPGPAVAATQIGHTFANPGTCSANLTWLQAVSPGNDYAVPFPGVITSWSYAAATPPALLKFKVGRLAGLDTFTIVGESGFKSPVPNALNTYTDVRITVQPGDVIGFYSPNSGWNCSDSPSGYLTDEATGDQPPGTTTTYIQETFTRLDISARLEPDADGDGFGDETQDDCPTDETTQGSCPVPETTITKHPKDKTRRKRAKFEFASSLPISSFECSLDGNPFAPCASPDSEKVKRGKHSFQVRAVAKGQTDPSPAADDWKVKRKKK